MLAGKALTSVLGFLSMSRMILTFTTEFAVTAGIWSLFGVMAANSSPCTTTTTNKKTKKQRKSKTKILVKLLLYTYSIPVGRLSYGVSLYTCITRVGVLLFVYFSRRNFYPVHVSNSNDAPHTYEEHGVLLAVLIQQYPVQQPKRFRSTFIRHRGC